MNPIYKKVKVLKPHCSICGERLKGNGSILLPYNCSCGEWEWEWVKGKIIIGNDYTTEDFKFELELQLKKKGE